MAIIETVVFRRGVGQTAQFSECPCPEGIGRASLRGDPWRTVGRGERLFLREFSPWGVAHRRGLPVLSWRSTEERVPSVLSPAGTDLRPGPPGAAQAAPVGHPPPQELKEDPKPRPGAHRGAERSRTAV